MTTPTHEPPDPELWGRLVEICMDDDDMKLSIDSWTSRRGDKWLVSLLSYGRAIGHDAEGPTWNDAARALIAEWEGRR